MDKTEFEGLENLRKDRKESKKDLRQGFREYELESDIIKTKNQELLNDLKKERAELKRDKESRKANGFSNDKDWIEHINGVITHEKEERYNQIIKENNAELDRLKEELDALRDDIWDIECKIQNRQLFYS